MAVMLNVLVVVIWQLFMPLLQLLLLDEIKTVEGTWCVARSDASDQAFQTALDYVCGAGADCAPIQSSGLCFLPNTLKAHASYAFNSFYQRKNLEPGSCDFAGTATIAQTDPSYGSCVYPSSPSTAGGLATPTTTSTTNAQPPPVGTAEPFLGNGGGGFPGQESNIPYTPTSQASLQLLTIQVSIPISLLSLYLFWKSMDGL